MNMLEMILMLLELFSNLCIVKIMTTANQLQEVTSQNSKAVLIIMS